MKHWFFIIIFIFMCLIGTQTYAKEIAGVELSDHVELSSNATQLQLNGAGIRKKFFFKIYIAALYLPIQTNNVEAILSVDGPRRMLMHILYSEVTKEKLTDGWTSGFKSNHSPEEMQGLQDRLDQFNQLFTRVVKNEVILLDYLPEQGTRVSISGVEKGLIPGADFYRALLKVWLGNKPVKTDLKKALLGGG